MTLRELRRLLAHVAAVEAVGAVSAVPTASAVGRWLPTLDTPRWKPPDAVFGPVWTVLYALQGIALWRVRREGPCAERAAAQRWFGVQLALNALWSFVFFGRRSTLGGLVDALALTAAVALTVRAVARLSRPAALLLAPYLLWVGFAAVLTAEIHRRNR